MEMFGKTVRENWFDKEYSHAGYNFKEVYRDEEYAIFLADDSTTHHEVYQRRKGKMKNYLPNKSHWGTYAWTCMSYDKAMAKIQSLKK